MAYQGTVVTIPLGTDGLTGSKDLFNVPPGYLTTANNVCFYDGTVRKEGGATKYNASAITGAPTILGGFEYQTNDLSQRMIVAANDGKLYKDTGDGSFGTTLKSGLSTSPMYRPFFVEGGKEAAALDRKLFVFTGTDVVQVVADDDNTSANLTAPPADWAGTNQPTFGLHHNFRILGAGNVNDPHRLYYSTPTDHEDFQGSQAGSLPIYPGEQEALIAGCSWKGRLILFKRPRGIYVVNMESPTVNEWTVERLTGTIGMASPWAWVQTENDIIFMDSTGAIQSLTATLSNLGEVEPKSLSSVADLDPFLRGDIKLSELDEVKAVYYVARREVHFTYMKVSTSVVNRRLVIDLNRPDQPRFRVSDRDTCTALWLRRDSDGIPRPLIGDNAGFVWQLDQTTRSKDGSGYSGSFTTVPTDLGYADGGLAHKRKNAAFLELLYEPTTLASLSCTLTWDGGAFTETVSFTLTTSGTYHSVRKRVTGGGKFLSLTFTNSTAGADFSLAAARLYFTEGAE